MLFVPCDILISCHSIFIFVSISEGFKISDSGIILFAHSQISVSLQLIATWICSQNVISSLKLPQRQGDGWKIDTIKFLAQQSFKLVETEKFLLMLKNYGNIKLGNSHCGTLGKKK
jgi:hypothetical protein